MDARRATPDLRRARWAVTAVFFLNGTLLATYIVRIPSLKVDHRLGDGELAVVLTLFGVAALLTMQFAGPLVARFGSARVIRLTLLAWPFGLAGVGLAGSGVQLGMAVVLAGAVHGTLDVAMNAHAVAVERERKQPIMNGCHAAWSISAVVASLAGASVIRAGVPPAGHFLGVGAVALLAGLVVTAYLLPSTTDQSTTDQSTTNQGTIDQSTTDQASDSGRGGGPRLGGRAGWTRPVLILGSMGFVVMICEAVVISWSGVFLHQYRGATLATAALGFTAFTACQTAGRLVGDRLHKRYGARALFRAGGVVAAAGLALVLLTSSPATGIAGFAILGLGGSVLVPLIFSAVGHAGGEGAGAATFLSRLTMFTYAGVLVGPALVGWFAEAVGLGWTMAGLLPLLAAVILGSRVMGSRVMGSRVMGSPASDRATSGLGSEGKPREEAGR